jgi:hypothetical protein
MTDIIDIEAFKRAIEPLMHEALPPEIELGAGPQRHNGHAAGTQDADPLPVVPYEVLAARARITQSFLIAGILPAEEGMLLSAKERSFKSFLTMEFSKACVLGRPLFGAFAVPEPLRVLLIDLENTRSRLCDRMDAALKHDGYSAADCGSRLVVLDRDDLPRWEYDAVGLARLAATVRRERPRLVVLDNLRRGTPAGRDECTTKDMLPVVRALAEMCEQEHTALILVHHDRRDGTGFSGSGALSGSMANEVHVKYDRKSRVATVHCESMRNAEPFTNFAVTMGRDGALVLCDLPEDAEDEEEQDCSEAVLHSLDAGAKMIKEIVDCTGLARLEVRGILGRLQAMRLVCIVGERNVGRGRPAQLYGRVSPKEDF